MRVRWEVHKSHSLDRNISCEFFVSRVGDISEESEERAIRGAVGLIEGREVPLASYIRLGLKQINRSLASEMT